MDRARLRYDEVFILLLEAENVIHFRTLAYISDNKDENFNIPYHLMHGHQPNKKRCEYDDIDKINAENVRKIYSKM